MTRTLAKHPRNGHLKLHWTVYFFPDKAHHDSTKLTDAKRTLL